ncbi:Isochorismatase-like protein [Kalaharituber pfeilii]|nr:Isochorismatase-like protein [Kalaharituber pfeilii]
MALPTERPSVYKPALLVVDAQEDFVPPNGSLGVAKGREIIPHVLSLLSLPFALKIFTKDTHPPDHISFAVNHPPPNNVPFTSYVDIVHPNNPKHVIRSRLWPVHCVKGTPGWEFVSGIKEWVETEQAKGNKQVVVVEKGYDNRVEMYSAFEDPFDGTICTSSPSLEAILRDEGITDVYVVGLAGDYCVKETSLHCAKKGFRTWIVREGVASVDESEAGWFQAKRCMESCQESGTIKVVSITGDVAAEWPKSYRA